MKIVTQYPDGVFSWVDLTTSDIAGAHAFYHGLFGWQADEQPVGDSGTAYTNFRIGGYTVAGGGQMQPEMLAGGAPSVWVSYVNHSDIDAVAERAAAAGGVVFLPPMDVLDAGRMALIQDPTGAPFGLWQPKTHVGAQVVNQPNSFVWNELQTSDRERARAFYQEVFGWTDRLDDTGYVTWHDGDRVQCGAIQIGDDWGDVSPHWLVYFLVDDVDATAACALELGGKVHHGPSAAGELGRLAVLADPQGAIFAAIKFNGPADDPPGVTVEAGE